MAPTFDAAKANFRGTAALGVVVAELELVLLLLLELVVAGLVLVAVVPNPLVVAVVVVVSAVVVPDFEDEDEDEDAVVVEARVVDPVATSPMEKLPLVAKIWSMLLMATASRVYPSPAGTIGRPRVILPDSGCTLLAMAKELWNTVLTSSKLQVSGSPASFDQVIVAVPPDVRPTGVLIVSA
jgi:hypothetical protein